MKKIIIKAVISVVVLIFVFSAGLWAGLTIDSIKSYFIKNESSSGTGGVSQEQKSGILDNISDGIKNRSSIKPFEEALDYISNDAFSEISRQELLRAAIEGMLSFLDDRHADYFTVEEYQRIVESYSGTMSGIGVIVTQQDDGSIVVVQTLPDTPADRAGIKKDDRIIKVDGVDISDMVLESVVAMIKGEEGTGVNITFYRPADDSEFEVDIIRERFYVPNLFAEIREGNIGYIQYIGFQDGGADYLDSEIDKLIKDGAEAIIFDIRNNPGGTLDDAVKVCDLFMDEGVIVTVRGRTDNIERVDEYLAKKGKYTEIPMVVLINGFSASASELVAGALKESGRATLIGETSFGKGTVQVIHELSDGSGIKFTSAKYFLPSGISIEGVGVMPDIEAELTVEDTEDVQLESALDKVKEIMKGKS
jgi:carboxyl-terminal processing protease